MDHQGARYFLEWFYVLSDTVNGGIDLLRDNSHEWLTADGHALHANLRHFSLDCGFRVWGN